MYRKSILLVLLFLFAVDCFPQKLEVKTGTKTETEISADLKKQAVEFLRESSREVNNLRTLENRISFASEMASLMWFYDEKEARSMMNTVIVEFKQLIAQYDSQITAAGIELPEGEQFYAGFFGSPDQNDKTRLLRKLTKAIVPVRQQITSSIAEHDAQLALDFYNSSLQMLSNPQVRKRFEEQSAYYEARLVNQIAEKDAGKALEIGRKSLAKGLNYNHVELLKKIYAKDAEKGADFADEIAKQLKDSKTGADNFYILGSALQVGSENFEKAKKDGKKPMFTDQTLRELAELMAQTLLKQNHYEEARATGYLNLIEKYAPASAAQVRTKMAIKAKSERGEHEDGIASAEGVLTASTAKTTMTTAEKTSIEKDEREEMMKSLQKLEGKQLPKEQREKIIGQARKIIAATPNRQQKMFALSALAAQVAKFGDKELASEIMKDAQNLVSSTPKNYLEFMEVWLLASGLAAADADKAFPILEDTIFRLNDTLSAFIKVGEFIDVSGEMIDDGEVQVGSFGGSMVKDLTSGLGMADATIMNLAKADFAKTRALTNKFERQEVRILAKMLVLRAVLGDQKKPTEEN